MTNRPNAASAAVALRVFVPFAAGYFLSYVFRTVNSIIAPDLVADLGIGADALGLLTSGYLLAFALAQLPLGILLDRFGPRRVEAALLLLAALGALAFAVAQELWGLVGGRALIGLGVSACMMASFKAFVQWFPRERLPLVNSLLLGVGATGAYAATVPVEQLLGYVGWRELFVALAVFALLVGGAVRFAVPEHAEAPAHPSMREQLLGLRQVFRSPYFWRVAPLTMLSQASFLAVQGLWAGPWLRDVAGLGRAEVANTLGLMAVAIVCGYVCFGALADRCARRMAPAHLAWGGMGLFLFTQLLLVLAPQWAPWLWLAFGFFGAAGTLPYAVLSQAFPRALAGRVNTALNLLVFLGAFAVQWGLGGILHLWEDAASRTYAPGGYTVGFLTIAVLQALAWLWWLVAGTRTGHADVQSA